MASRPPPRTARSCPSCAPSLAVGPVKLVEDPVGLLRGHRHAGRGGAERPLTALALLPDEAARQVDVGKVLLAGHRVLEGVAPPLADALGPEGALPALALDRDLRLDQAHDLGRGPHDLPRHAAELPREDLPERLDLRVGGRRVHDERDLAVPLVDRLGPRVDAGALHAGEVHVAARAPRDVQADERVAASVRGVREAAEVAAAAEVAVAELVALALERPAGAVGRRHASPPSSDPEVRPEVVQKT